MAWENIVKYMHQNAVLEIDLFGSSDRTFASNVHGVTTIHDRKMNGVLHSMPMRMVGVAVA